MNCKCIYKDYVRKILKIRQERHQKNSGIVKSSVTSKKNLCILCYHKIDSIHLMFEDELAEENIDC